MRQVKQPTSKVGEILSVIALLLVVALSVFLWAKSGETAAANPLSSASPAGAPATTATTANLSPPADLSLSVVADRPNRLHLTYTRSQAPHYYQFQLQRRDLSASSETWTVADTRSDRRPPDNFYRVARGYHYRARGRNCSDAARTSCGNWSDFSPALEFSDPTIAISGIVGSYIAGDSDPFTATPGQLHFNS